MINTMISLVEKGILPDTLVRTAIRKLVNKRLKDEQIDDVEKCDQRYHDFLQELKVSALAIETDKANEQHYEVDVGFYQHTLGSRKKYSSSYYLPGDSLDQAELRMLDLYVERGQFVNGQDILELGCGWGSLTLFLAETFPESKILAVSNSNSQRQYILSEANKQGLKNIDVITCDINQLNISQQFDRVVSIEMFEHIRNYQNLFDNIASWLKPDGKMFVHIFCHRYLMYPFVAEGDDNWMGKYFFSGGQMPAADTFYHFQDRLKIEQRWINSGSHYQKTADHWLANMDKNKNQIMPIFENLYGEDAKLWFQRWRIFFMSCAELFGYDKGRQWLVGHYLFSKQQR